MILSDSDESISRHGMKLRPIQYLARHIPDSIRCDMYNHLIVIVPSAISPILVIDIVVMPVVAQVGALVVTWVVHTQPLTPSNQCQSIASAIQMLPIALPIRL